MMIPEKPVILIADDHMPSRLLGRKYLSQEGFHVLEAESGQEAVQIFRDQKPDIVLLDVIMPEMDGFSTCRELRTEPHGHVIPILMMTGLDDFASINHAYEVGATDFITKPINWLIICHRLRYMLRANSAFVNLNKTLCDLRKSEHRLSKAQRIAQLGHFEYHINTNQVIWSPEALQILGLSQDKLSISLEDFFQLAHLEDRLLLEQQFLEVIEQAKNLHVEYRIIQANDEIKTIAAQIEFTFDETKQNPILAGTIQDVSERKKNEDKIRYLAYYDSLTNLPNRYTLEKRLADTLKYATRYNHTMAILFIDVNQFKRINDTLGHSAGDTLLKKVAARLRICVRDTNHIVDEQGIPQQPTLARFGGDEFVVLLNELQQPSDAIKITQRILSAFEESILLEGHEIYVSLSIGLSIFPNDGVTVRSLLKSADAAMYHAKKGGRNQYRFYSDTMNTKTIEHISLESSLHKAMETSSLLIYYQPKLDTQSNKIIGMEALLRWKHPERGIIPPAEFIPLAEETGLIMPISEWMLLNACRQLREWMDEGMPPLELAVNLSGKQFHQIELANTILSTLNLTGIPPELLNLELTESILMKNDDDTMQILHKLKKMGVKISIDDFGTGYSSLSYLKGFPIDYLKIDKSFIGDITESEPNNAITKTIITMAHNLNLKVVAEGVEKEQQAAFLRQHNCDEMQGYLYGKPMPGPEFANLVLQSRTEL